MDDVTHCLTIGRRPDLLRQSLASLTPALRALPTLAVNDFGDAETDAVFRELVPAGRIVGPGHHVGHHPAVDALYAEVTTPLVWHDEDDWIYTRGDFLAPARQLLATEPRISVVCFRGIGDFTYHTEAERAKVVREVSGGVAWHRLDGLHAQWHGFTFNPHLARLDLWRRFGPYAAFEKERHISRAMRAAGLAVAFLDPGACVHGGDERSVIPRRPKRFKALRDWWRGRR